MSDQDVVVIGAGLAGPSAAARLAHAGRDVVVLEARDRVGGRVEEGRLPDGSPIELGGQWVGPTQSRMRALVDELGLELFRTHDVGDHLLVVDGQTFETWLQRACPTKADRLGAAIEFDTVVSGLDQRNEDVVVSSTDGRTWSARQVVVALPLHLAGGLTMHPSLPSARQQALQRVPMGSVIKLHVVFERPWWRARGLSGQVLSDGAGPQVVFDNSVPGSELGVLLAFLEGDEAVAWADGGSDARAEMPIARLQDLFGGEVPSPIAVVQAMRDGGGPRG